ncbi:MAG: hypothetical protein ACRDNZ_21325 [Streptosporangiaceae bacterium]
MSGYANFLGLPESTEPASRPATAGLVNALARVPAPQIPLSFDIGQDAQRLDRPIESPTIWSVSF